MASLSSSIKFCCYQVQATTEDNEQEERKMLAEEQVSVPMLSIGTNSKIKFTNVSKKNDQPVYELLLQLYENKSQANEIFKFLSKKRINPDFKGIGQRDDLEYYVPQLITYLVIEENLSNLNLIQIILEACATDFYFAHSVYFYLNSFTSNWMNQPIQNVIEFIRNHFLPRMNIYCKNRLSGIQFTKGMIAYQKHLNQFPEEQKFKGSQSIQLEITYGTKQYPNPPPELPPTLQRFTKKRYDLNGFLQTPTFWEDLISIGQDISSVPAIQRNIVLDHMIKTRVNTKLPASVYIPFFKNNLRMYTVLCVWKGRLFSTKQRAPFSIWVQLYREQEELQLIEQVIQAQMSEMKCPKKEKKQKILDKIYDTLSKPFSIAQHKNTINLKKYFKQKFGNRVSADTNQQILKDKISIKSRHRSTFHEPGSIVNKEHKRFALSFVYDSQNQDQNKSSNSVSSSIESSDNKQKFEQNIYQQSQSSLDDYFPPKSTKQIQEFRRRSIYRNLKSWRIAHLMVKTGDDLKQEQFAMQLIYNFANIFKKEKINCAVFPYEVISLGPNYGILEMLQDVTTFDSLFKNLSQKNMTLKQFFNTYFPDKFQAKKNFMRSLAGYCLITYFLQVKDRHNGNILLNREGYMIHIDFGFFLSNMPGKGVELEKNVPFKLLTQYVQVLGSLNSQMFFQFRRLFYKGFLAITKHKESILSLVKMMYSSHEESMSCFIKSEEAVLALQKRLNPPQNIEEFCYELINNSLDNWRSKWYDKFQYFLQKIYY